MAGSLRLVLDAHRQVPHRVRFEWGLAGARAVAPSCDYAIVIDVLSFTTTLSVAIDLGWEVLPYRWRDESAAAFAQEYGATLAGGRSQPGLSLSPAAIRAHTKAPGRLVLPSPNGSTIAHALTGPIVLGACLRNASAVAAVIPDDATVAVIAGGEHWPDGSLRPAVEDLWGAGAVLSHLTAGLSPEATMAAAAWQSVQSSARFALRACASGRELIDRGFAEDVEIAAEVDASRVVPQLEAGVFRAGES